MAQSEAGIFTTSTDIGQPRHAGSTKYDPVTQRYIMAGAGTNMWDACDEFQFAWEKIKGDFLIQAQVKLVALVPIHFAR